MAVYKTFKNGELLHTVIRAAPEIIYTSGSAGVTTNYSRHADGALSLYEGVRGRSDVKDGDFALSGLSVYPLDPMDTHTSDRVLYVSGSYPATGSMRFYIAHNDDRTETNTDKSDNRFRAVGLLFDYYSKFNSGYHTASVDYYSMFFYPNGPATTPAIVFTGSNVDLPDITTQMTVEANVRWLPKTTFVTGSRYTIASQKNRFSLSIDASSGVLYFADRDQRSIVVGATVPSGSWHHVAVTIGSNVVKFYLDGAIAGTGSYTGSLSFSPLFLPVIGGTADSGDYSNVYDGFYGDLHEVRIWRTTRTAEQIAANYWKTLIEESGSANLALYARFTEGPTASASVGGGMIVSATFDSSRTQATGALLNFQEALPVAPMWQPNDNQWFFSPKKRNQTQTNHMAILEIPSMFYGRQIATGSFRLELNAFNKHLQRHVIVDDGRGSLYLSGSRTVWVTGTENRSGVKWRSVGNIFYSEGVAAITDPAILDLWRPTSYTSSMGLLAAGTNLFSNQPYANVSFRGDQRIASKVFVCRAGPAEANGSNNTTYSIVSTDDDFGEKREISHPTNTTYITAVGIYDSERKLVAVAKLAQPIRKREKDKLNIRLRMDF